MSALFMPPRNGQSFVLCCSSRDVRPGSDRHLEQLDKPQRRPANRIEAFLPVTPTRTFTTPNVTIERVPGGAPLKEIVSRIIQLRSAAAATT